MLPFTRHSFGTSQTQYRNRLLSSGPGQHRPIEVLISGEWAASAFGRVLPVRQSRRISGWRRVAVDLQLLVRIRPVGVSS